jgi:hypothetical protein
MYQDGKGRKKGLKNTVIGTPKKGEKASNTLCCIRGEEELLDDFIWVTKRMGLGITAVRKTFGVLARELYA